MNAGWLVLALVVVAAAIGGYALLLGIRKNKLQRRIAELEERPSEDLP